MNQIIKAPKGTFCIECWRRNQLLWREIFGNLVTDPGRTDILEKYFRGVGYTAAWFMGLKGGLGGQAISDTLASHAGWAEVNPQGANRVALTFSAAAAKFIATGQFDVAISLAGPTNVGGGFVASVQTGTAGILYSVGDFSQLRSVAGGDTLRLSQTFGS